MSEQVTEEVEVGDKSKVKKVRKNKPKKIQHTDTLEELNSKIETLEISLEVTKSMRNIAQKMIDKKEKKSAIEKIPRKKSVKRN